MLAQVRMQTANQNQAHAPSKDSVQRKRTEEEVVLLLREYRITHNPAVRDRIVLQYTNLVESIARRFSGAAEPVEDLAQEGYIGLITSVELYDPEKNVKFSTYATHFIIGQIKHSLRDRGKIIKEPAWLQELNQRMTRVIESLAQQLSRPPSNLEIANIMQMTEEAVAEMMMTREIFKVGSIDGSANDGDDDGSAVDMERQKGMDATVSFQLPVEDRLVLDTAMLKLKELEQKVLSEFFYKDLNQTEIARNLGISCNYVSHILRNSTRKLKKILVTEEVRDSQLTHRSTRERSATTFGSDSSSVVDMLTRLYNRSYFEARLQEELSRASRYNGEVGILIIKLGGLSQFIHSCGTLRGDEVIQGAAELIQEHIRRSDILTRFDEDTFGLILPHTGQNVVTVSTRLAILMTDWLAEKGWDQGRAPITLGFGSAAYPQDAGQFVSLQALALEQTVSSMTAINLTDAA